MDRANRSHVFYRTGGASPPSVVAGEGVYLIDDAGRRYLDASGGAAVSCLGHDHPRVIQAIKDQLERVPYAHTSFFTAPAAEALATELKRRAMDVGLLCYPMGGCIDGRLGDHVLLAPPYVISAAEVDLIVERLASALDTSLAEIGV